MAASSAIAAGAATAASAATAALAALADAAARAIGASTSARSTTATRAALAALAVPALLTLSAAIPTPAAAQTTLQGRITDHITGQPLAGANVALRRGAELVQPGVTNAEGRFVMTVNVGNAPQAQNFKLAVASEAYVAGETDVVIASGRATRAAYDLALVRQALADCARRLARERRVVVGQFIPPASAAATAQFSERVALAVRRQLLFLERSGMARERQHLVVACPEIVDNDDLAEQARALTADTVMAGSVAPGSSAARFDLSMLLRDANGLFDGQPSIRSANVNLDDPDTARLSPQALMAVVQGLATGHLRHGQAAECETLLGLYAQTLAGRTLPPALVGLRQDCRRQLPAAGLLQGTP